MNKINRILIGILIIFLTAVISTAVPVSTMNKVIDIDNSEAFDVTDHDGYIFAGQNETRAAIFKTDSNGNVISKKVYDENNGSYFSDIKLTSENGYIMVGTSGVELHNNDDEWLYSGLIIKIDEDRNEMWKRYIREGDLLSLKSVYQTLDSGYIVLGNIMYYDGNPQSLFLIKFDHEGNTIFSKTLTNNSDLDYSSKVIQTIDEGYAVTGSINDGLNGIVIKIDGNGDIIWTKVFKNIGHVSSIIQLSSGAYIATGYLENEYPRPKNSWITKISKNGKIKWLKYIDHGIFNEINSVKQTKGGYILAGTLYGNNNEPNGGMLIKTNKRGKELWNIVPGDNSYSKLYNVIEMYPNEYTSFGYKCNIDINECGTYFIKVENITSPNGY